MCERYLYRLPYVILEPITLNIQHVFIQAICEDATHYKQSASGASTTGWATGWVSVHIRELSH